MIPLHSSTNPASPSLFQALKWNCVRLLWLLLRNPCCHARDINCISPEPAALQAAQGPAAVADIWRCPNAGWPKRFEIKSSAASAVWLQLTSAFYVPFWRSISPKRLSPNILKQKCTPQFLSSLKAANRWCKLHKSQRTRIASAIGIGAANFLSLTEQAA